MDDKPQIQLLTKILAELDRTIDEIPGLSELLLRYGGVDTEGLSTGQIIAGIQDVDDAPWDTVTFGMGETMALFGADENWSAETAAIWAIAVIILGNSLPRTDRDTDIPFFNTVRAAARAGQVLSTNAVAGLLEYLITRLHLAE